FSARVNFVFERIAAASGIRVRNVRGWVASMTGRADAVTINGVMALVAHGTGPRDMNEDAFRAFWSDAKLVIIEEVCPTLPERDATDVLQMIADMERIDGES